MQTIWIGYNASFVVSLPHSPIIELFSKSSFANVYTHKKRLRAKIPEAEKWRSAQSTVDKVATPNHHHLTTAPAKIQFNLLLLLNSCSQIYTPFWVSWWHSLWKQVTGNWYQPITRNSKSALAIQRRDQHFFTPFQFHTK